MSTAVQLSAVVAHPVVYPVTEAEIAAARQKFAALSADTAAGYEEVRIAIGQLRTARTSIEKRRVELKADALAYGKRVDDAAKKLTALVVAIEQPLQAKKDAVDQKEEERKREAERAEMAAREAALKVEAARVAEEKAKHDAEREVFLAAQREAQAKLDAERAALDEERRKVEAQQREAARVEEKRQAEARAERLSKEQDERDRIEAEQAAADAVTEAARLDAMKPDLEKAVAFAAEIRQLARRAPLLGQEPREAVEWAAGRLGFIAKAIEDRMATLKGEG